jgi:arsenate reductase
VTEYRQVNAPDKNGTRTFDAKRRSILFLCVHNAGRSQMAAAFAEHMGRNRVEVLSAGSEPASQINPAVIAAMEELGIDLKNVKPRKVEDDDFKIADVVITMGCGDSCKYYPGKRYEDWDIPDPSSAPMDQVRQIRDEIKQRVERLLSGLGLLNTSGS